MKTKFKSFFILLYTFMFMTSFSNNKDDLLMKKVGQMFISTFEGSSFINSINCNVLIEKYYVGGLLLMSNNITEKEQTKDLINDIKGFAEIQKRTPLFICIDEEGEFVRRLKTEAGFRKFDFSAFDVGEVNDKYFTAMVYQEMADDLHYIGANFNFAPVVDIDVNLNNPIIAKFKRSFSSDPDVVIKHAGIMIDIMKKNNILTVLKHFPGHGSSVIDSHDGITDISDTFEMVELEPFVKLKSKANAIMIGHLLDKKIDDIPATVSKKWVNGILQKKYFYNGLIITDDISMKGLTSRFSLEEIIQKTVEAGNDLIVISDYSQVTQSIEILFKLVKDGTISERRINQSYNKILATKRKFKI